MVLSLLVSSTVKDLNLNRSTMPHMDFPLRWESTGNQWWYASPIDWAAANGHYDLVRELLLLDPNLLIKLTSLRRIRRLETVWDDDARFSSAAKCRSSVARNLLLHCQSKANSNSLIRAGYGGWLMYTAASAGDLRFVRELLERDPMMVFGEGEYGVSDVLYAAARSRDSEVFRVLFDLAVAAPGAEIESSVFRREMVNRGVHAAARGGDLVVLRELMGECEDVLEYRDGQGSTVLHSAAGRGQAEVVKDLVASFDIIYSVDNQGSSPLHVAAFRGHLPVVEALLQTSPSSSSSINYAGDTFLHMAVAGFRTTGFRRLDKQMELMKQLVCGTIINIQEIVNIRNNEGRTVLHMAMIGNVHANLVELLMTVPSINLNVVDIHGMTPLDLLNQCPRTASSMILIRQLISAGGSSNSKFHCVKSATTSQVKMQGNGNSPGTSFTIPDAEIFRYTGVEALEDSDRPSSSSSASKSEIQDLLDKKQSSLNRAARLLKILLGWWRSTETQSDTPKKHVDDDSLEFCKKLSDHDEIPTPLRQRSSQASSLLNNKRTLTIRNSIPIHATKNEYTSDLMHYEYTPDLMHGVFHSMPHMDPPDDFTNSISVSLTSINPKGVYSENENGVASCSKSSANSGKVDNVPQKLSSMNSGLINQYLCFGAQGLAVHNPIRRTRSTQLLKRLPLSVA